MSGDWHCFKYCRRESCRKMGERYGKKVGATINDKVDSSNSIIRNPDSFNEEAGVLLYEKLFNH